MNALAGKRLSPGNFLSGNVVRFLLSALAMTRISSTLALALAFSLAACGGSSNSGLTGPGSGGSGGGAAGSGGGAAGSATDGGGGAATGGAAGTPASGGSAGANGGSAGYTLDNVCQKTAPVGCQLDKSCCQASGFGYDQSGCEAHALAGCEKDVAEVKAGTMKFDPSKVDACIAALGPVVQKCVPKANEYFGIFDALAPCNQIWKGTLPQGASCDRNEQCAPSGNPDVYVSCDKKTKKCTHFAKLSLGQPCELSDAMTAACGPGLYCDASLVGVPPYKGSCKTATPEGKGCDVYKPFDLECGFGFYCNQSTGVCTAAKVGGASCQETVECQTMTCTLGKCTSESPLVDQATCTG